MIVIPAVDIKDGNCVRLVQGSKYRETIYSDDPVLMAKNWQQQGAKRIHIVDLNGAFKGNMQNQEVIHKIINELDVPVEVGGGIRDLETIESLIDEGAYRVVLGTSAVNDKNLLNTAIERWPDKIVVGVDSINGNIAVRGWTQMTTKDAQEFAVEMELAGVKEIIVTDISTDGMLSGPNIGLMKKIAQSVNMAVIASGGVSNVEDIKNLKELKIENLIGVIIGKALYSGNISLEKAIKVLEADDNGF